MKRFAAHYAIPVYVMLCLLSISGGQGVFAATLRISLDTGSAHLRNQTVERFQKALQPHDLEVQVFAAGQLGNDRDLPKALHWQTADMGLPALSKLTRYLPEAALFSLPSLHIVPMDQQYALYDSPLADDLLLAIESHLQVKVLRPLVPLGFTNIYLRTPLTQTLSLTGLKIRAPGGAGALSRLRLYGAAPVSLPIGDVPLALAQNAIDGVESTHETILSTGLYQAGLQSCLEGFGTLIMYIPIIRGSWWRALSPLQQQQVERAWQWATEDIRDIAHARQARAAEELKTVNLRCEPWLRRVDRIEAADLDAATRSLAKDRAMDRDSVESLLQFIEALQDES